MKLALIYRESFVIQKIKCPFFLEENSKDEF
jgi:hypothetical protein